MGASKKTEEKKPDIEIKYIIPDHVVDCHVNGVHGGITTTGKLYLHAYSERQAIPKKAGLYFQKDKDGSPITDGHGKILKSGEETYSYGADIVRVIQASLIMDYDVAVSVLKWLQQKIDSYHSVMEEIKDDSEK